MSPPTVAAAYARACVCKHAVFGKRKRTKWQEDPTRNGNHHDSYARNKTIPLLALCNSADSATYTPTNFKGGSATLNTRIC